MSCGVFSTCNATGLNSWARLDSWGREIVPFPSFDSTFFSFCHRTLGGLEMSRVWCLSNSLTKCCFPITIYLGNCLSHYLYSNCSRQMVLYALNVCPSHFNRHCPVIWDSRPEKEKYLHVIKCEKNAFDLVGEQKVLVIWVYRVMCF